MRYSEYLIWGAVVILLISVISIIVRKDEQRFLQTFFFLGFGAVFLYFVRLTDIDSDFWISDFHDLPLSRMYILCAIIIPLLAAGLTALLSFAVHRLADRRRNEIIIGAVYAAVVICLFQLESPLYDRVYEAAWISYYNRIVEEELTLIQGHGSEKDFSYLIPVSDELLGVGFVNEYGDQILMCQLDGFGPYGIIDGKFRIAVEQYASIGEHAETSQWYILDENGMQAGNQQYSNILAFSEEKNMILARSVSNFKYGAVDAEGREVIPFEYEYEEIWEEAGIDPEGNSAPGFEWEREGLYIEETEDEIPYVTDGDGNVIIPPQDEKTGEYNTDVRFAENGSPYILVKGAFGADMALYDYEGNAVIPMGNYEIHADSENGWLCIRNNDTGNIVFADENMETVLDLGSRYEYAYGAIRIG